MLAIPVSMRAYVKPHLKLNTNAIALMDLLVSDVKLQLHVPVTHANSVAHASREQITVMSALVFWVAMERIANMKLMV